MRAIIPTSLLLSLLIACQSGDDDDGQPPGGGADSGPGGGDGGGGGEADGGVAALQCSTVRQLDRYPWGITAGTYLAEYQLLLGIAADDLESPLSQLTLEVWPGPGGGSPPSIPADRTFTTSSKYNTCDVCLLMAEGRAGNTCQTYFFPQAGSVRVSEASAQAGKLTGSGSNLVFREWSIATDAPVPGGRCVELVSFDLAAEWGEGGTCSGDECGPDGQCCADSPYCSLGNDNIGHYCSDYCGASGDSCLGADDCCDGFTCFLGTCIRDGCAGDSCSVGLDEGGGCCGEAPYCTSDSRCRPTCGDSGEECGGDLDCCTGLSCAAGTCV
jgi:hypothetical protein